MDSKISVDQFLRKSALGEKMIIVDLRETDAYCDAHVRGAISIPLRQLGTLARSYLGLPGTQVLVYGDLSEEHSPLLGARQLAEIGYTDVFACKGSFDQWRSQGAPIESTPDRIRLNFT